MLPSVTFILLWDQPLRSAVSRLLVLGNTKLDSWHEKLRSSLNHVVNSIGVRWSDEDIFNRDGLGNTPVFFGMGRRVPHSFLRLSPFVSSQYFLFYHHFCFAIRVREEWTGAGFPQPPPAFTSQSFNRASLTLPNFVIRSASFLYPYVFLIFSFLILCRSFSKHFEQWCWRLHSREQPDWKQRRRDGSLCVCNSVYMYAHAWSH